MSSAISLAALALRAARLRTSSAKSAPCWTALTIEVALQHNTTPTPTPSRVSTAAKMLALAIPPKGANIWSNSAPAAITPPGTDKNQEKLLIVAHYNTISHSPSADDNASGVAVLLGLTRVFAEASLHLTVEFIAVNLEENEREKEPKGRGLANIKKRYFLCKAQVMEHRSLRIPRRSTKANPASTPLTRALNQKQFL